VDGLFSNLLSWSRVKTGLFAYQPQRLQLAPLLEETVQLLQSDAARKGLSVKLEVDPSVSIQGDATLLAKVFENLLANSIKYSHHGDPVEVKVDADKESVLVHFLDWGIGIDEELVGRLFEMDQSVLRPGTDGETGSGLGLMLSRALVEQHQGTILVFNREEGGGMEVCVSFPRIIP
jgi:signal transduction histidine kinase